MHVRKPILTTFRTIALFEAAKGLLVLFVGLGLLSLINHDVQAFAERIVRLSHLKPASHYPQIFVDASRHVTGKHLWELSGAAMLYATVRGIEAYGLWNESLWAEWFALIATGIFVPLEIYELIHRASGLKATVLLTNLAIVACMAWALLHPAEQAREVALAKSQAPNDSIKK